MRKNDKNVREERDKKEKIKRGEGKSKAKARDSVRREKRGWHRVSNPHPPTPPRDSTAPHTLLSLSSIQDASFLNKKTRLSSCNTGNGTFIHPPPPATPRRSLKQLAVETGGCNWGNIYLNRAPFV
jgi:hypothetical protein